MTYRNALCVHCLHPPHTHTHTQWRFLRWRRAESLLRDTLCLVWFDTPGPVFCVHFCVSGSMVIFPSIRQLCRGTPTNIENNLSDAAGHSREVTGALPCEAIAARQLSNVDSPSFLPLLSQRPPPPHWLWLYRHRCASLSGNWQRR